MKYFVLLCLALTSLLPISAQSRKSTPEKYLAGAVPQENGLISFRQNFNAPQHSQAELYETLLQFVKTQLLVGEDQLPQSRITELSPEQGRIVASIEENLWFKRSAWVSDWTRFYYQIIFQCAEGKFSVEMRRLRYFYEPTVSAGIEQVMNAEDWISDKEALKKNGTQLTRIGGKKFRVHTIDRKDALFQTIAQACNATPVVQ